MKTGRSTATKTPRRLVRIHSSPNPQDWNRKTSKEVSGRLTKDRQTASLDSVWIDHAQHWPTRRKKGRKPTLGRKRPNRDASRQIRSIFDFLPEGEDHEDTIQHARKKLVRSVASSMPCFTQHQVTTCEMYGEPFAMRRDNPLRSAWVNPHHATSGFRTTTERRRTRRPNDVGIATRPQCRTRTKFFVPQQIGPYQFR